MTVTPRRGGEDSMATYSHQELDDTRSAPTGAPAPSGEDWDAWADLFTADCTYFEHCYGLMQGRETVRKWISPVMAKYGEIYTGYEWHASTSTAAGSSSTCRTAAITRAARARSTSPASPSSSTPATASGSAKRTSGPGDSARWRCAATQEACAKVRPRPCREEDALELGQWSRMDALAGDRRAERPSRR